MNQNLMRAICGVSAQDLGMVKALPSVVAGNASVVDKMLRGAGVVSAFDRKPEHVSSGLPPGPTNRSSSGPDFTVCAILAAGMLASRIEPASPEQAVDAFLDVMAEVARRSSPADV